MIQLAIYVTDLTSLTSRFQNFDQLIWSETSRFFSGIAEVRIYDKKSLKDCHKLCVIYSIFSPDPEGDWGLR